MFSLFARREVLRNVLMLAAAPGDEALSRNLGAARAGHRAFLRPHQPMQSIRDRDDQFVDAMDAEAEVAGAYGVSWLNDRGQDAIVGERLALETRSRLRREAVDLVGRKKREFRQMYEPIVHNVSCRATGPASEVQPAAGPHRPPTVVRTEIALARKTFHAGSQAAVHPLEPTLVARARGSIDESRGRPASQGMLTPRTRETLDRCAATLTGLETSA